MSKKPPTPRKRDKEASRPSINSGLRVGESLAKEEWDFSGVPDEERNACLYFEYGRESFAVCRDLTVWLKHFPHGAPWPDFREVSDIESRFPLDAESLRRFYYSPARISIASPDFPNVAWSSISMTDRQRAMQSVGWESVERRLADRKRAKSRRPLLKLASKSFDVGNWSASDAELIGRFKRWLLLNREYPEDRKKAGRKSSPKDALSYLIALRLCRHAKIKRGAVSKVIEIHKRDPANVNRDVKKAKAFLSGFYK